MAIKTFSVGELATSSDVNEYLANAGLVYVASGTVSNNTAINFTSIFTSSFTNYYVVFTPSARQTASQNQINLRVRSGSTDLSTGSKYQWSRVFYYAAASGSSGSTTANEINLSDGNTAFSSFAFDIYAPFVAQETFITGQASIQQNVGGPFLFGTNFGGFVDNTTAYDGISIIGTSNFSGTARVYGYRQI
jgi:hypothetical protein